MSSEPADTRTRILEAAQRLLMERGSDRVRMEDVASAAGVSRQSVYLHFGNRTALFIAAARHLDQTADLAGRLKAFQAEQDPLESLRLFIEFWGNYIPVIYPLGSALMARRDTDEAARAAWENRMERVREGCQITVDRLHRADLLSSAWTKEIAVDLVFGLVSVPLWQLFTNELHWTTAEFVDRMTDVVRSVLLGSIPDR